MADHHGARIEVLLGQTEERSYLLPRLAFLIVGIARNAAHELGLRNRVSGYVVGHAEIPGEVLLMGSRREPGP